MTRVDKLNALMSFAEEREDVDPLFRALVDCVIEFSKLDLEFPSLDLLDVELDKICTGEN